MVKRSRRDRELRRRDETTPPRPPRVLVAEDDTDLRGMVVHELLAVGYDVTEARTGVELLDQVGDALLSGERSARPDVILSDIRMPGLWSLDILTSLRDEKWRTGMIVMTAYADGETRRRVAKIGAALFEKPFEIGDLLAAVKSAHQGFRESHWPPEVESPSSRRMR